MARLWFQNSLGKKRQIADCDTRQEVLECIRMFINQANVGKAKDKQFKSYYTREWSENGRTWFDVGSWSEFFIWDKVIE